MLTPFAPVFVLFCHALETLSVPDLETIQVFSLSLRQLSGATEAAGRMYLLFQAMCDVLQACVDDACHNQQEVEFDAALASLSQTDLTFLANGMDIIQTSEPADFSFVNTTLFE